MSTSDDHLFNLHDELLQIKDSELYTGDGSVDVNGKPVLKSKTGNWKACLFVLGTECCERLAFSGIDANLVTYLTQQMRQGNASAARIASTWSGTCYVSPLIGAFLADSYWGRYQTIFVFSSIYIIGLCAFALSATFPAFQPADSVSIFPQYALFFVGLYLIAVGTGGIKPCVPSFGADQFDDTDTNERIKKGSFFNWFYFSISLGSLISNSLLVWIQENVGWSIGYGIPAVCMGVALMSFFSGTRYYRYQRPGGSPLTRICQVIVASFRKCKLDSPQDTSLLHETSDVGNRKLEHTEGLEFLDKAAVMTNTEMKTEDISAPWKLCTITQVEELKILIRLFPIWVTGIVDFAAHAQRSTTFIEQGTVMDRKIGSFTIPAASLATCAVFSSFVWVPIYEKTIVPLARKLTRKERGFSDLQRMGIGLFLTVIAMVFATLVETRRLQVAKEPGRVPLSILWQVPQYVILGISDVFTYVGRLQFLYDQSPDSMRSLCTAFGLLIIAFGCYLSSFVLFIVTSITTAKGKPGWVPNDLNKGKLDNYFGFWAGFCLLNLLVYVLCAMRYKHKVLKIMR
ncbi:protein NRT1/ PTR FAMILY 8.3-like [Silene latifolia]|uniref:protein NRT1/ PTR FAMILY 8.3-like n=1 Tax=Silene latifolia TaxID=37657 RepID=UPI003D783F9D